MGRTIGGKREVKLYSLWCIAHPYATKEEHQVFLQKLLDDPENSLKKKAEKDVAASEKS